MDNLTSKSNIEETDEVMIDFEKLNGVIPVAVQHAETREIILIAYVNQMALDESINKKMAIFWSTSRNELWVKGTTSGNYFDLLEDFVNCEQNSLVYKALPRTGGICHTKNKAGKSRNCFYRRLNMNTRRLENLDI